ncbi:hypothetical protein [Streptomyces avermitilis]|uniref:hypothetical protein n=1 Tax=Streptomyces avermitilis TaxID=33903 RepID=UPI0038277DDA
MELELVSADRGQGRGGAELSLLSLLGLAHNAADVAEFLRRVGLEIDPAEVAETPWIDWRGEGLERWGPETSS